MYFFSGLLSGAICGSVVAFWLLKNKLSALKRKLNTDTLTGFKNAYYLEEILKNAINNRNCFVLIDIDNFKDNNTKFGYENTDTLLKLFAEKLNRHFNDKKEIVRYKFGDEFLIILKEDLTSVQVKLSIEIFRDKMDKEPFEVNNIPVFIQFSAGVVFISENAKLKGIDLKLKNALNNALYEAKKLKNLTVICQL